MEDALKCFPEVRDVVDPLLYDMEAQELIPDLELGKSPAVVVGKLPDDLPADVVLPIRKLAERMYEVVQLEEADMAPGFVGVDAIKERFKLALSYNHQYQENKQRTGVGFHPSMHKIDSTGHARWGAVGSDQGRVRTFINENGERESFAIQIFGKGSGPRVRNFFNPTVTAGGKAAVAREGEEPPQVKPGVEVADVNEFPSELIVNDDPDKPTIVLECPICGHAESYPREDPTQEDIMLVKMQKHCQNATNEEIAHKALYDELVR